MLPIEFNSIEQLKSEQNIFNHSTSKRKHDILCVHIPTSCIKTRTTAHKPYKQDNGQLETTSKVPFNFSLLENVLFVSTLSECLTRSYDFIDWMDNKQHSFHSHNARRTSIQSDAYSTELIRRFSSGSTTSSLSSISSYFSCQGDAQTHSKDDPGHDGCDTLPIWADPNRIAENPTRFQYLMAYLRQQQFPPSLPLQKSCLFYFSQNTSDYVNAIQCMLQVDTVWKFSSCWRTLKGYKKPSEFSINQNLYCFVQGVQPMWEDPVNAKGGGRLVIVSHQLDNLFEWLLCAFVGGQLYDEGCVGVVVSKKAHGDRVELWFDQYMTQEKVPLLK
ncbi:hypothetical protein CU098_008063 [Rhizopus stolonifer]|uniref:Eukaryotic translation initiation factor 4E type 2 n=1 Tax=Rhizopus stolonifer TaxID=4846 RepID=A0A367J0I8_RHIST|nr:hypothetical protein CU098_008063 [Rhizopus stolonifer]